MGLKSTEDNIQQIKLFDQPDIVEPINYADMSIKKSILWMTTITDTLKPASKLYINYYIGRESQNEHALKNGSFTHMTTTMREIAQAVNISTKRSGSLRAIVELLVDLESEGTFYKIIEKAFADENDTSIMLGHFIKNVNFKAKKKLDKEKFKQIQNDSSLDGVSKKIESILSFVDWNTVVDFDPHESFEEIFFSDTLGGSNQILFAELVRLKRASETAFSAYDFVFGHADKGKLYVPEETMRTLLRMDKSAASGQVTRTANRAFNVVSKYTRIDVDLETVKEGKNLVGYNLNPKLRSEKADNWIFDGLKLDDDKTKNDTSVKAEKDVFKEIWKNYPKKTRRGLAEENFYKALASGSKMEDIYQGTLNYIDFMKKNPNEKPIHGFTFFSPKRKLWENYL